MKPLTLNLLTSAGTAVLLGALTLPAVHELGGGAAPRPALAAAPAQRGFGVYVDPWHADDWAREVGAAPQMVATFEAFSRDRTIDPFVRETERQGIRQVMVSWEPWRPPPISAGTANDGLAQPGYTNAEIARGAHDAYIRRFARSLAGFRGTVWLRYAHEMNGDWYPWAHGPAGYVRAWRHVVKLVRSSGARNVRFVWSPNMNLYQRDGVWLTHMEAYWPGAEWVDAVGATMINFGPARYGVENFARRLGQLHRLFRKPMMITEANTAYDGRVGWLNDLRQMLRRMPWLRTVVWSQLPSRGLAQTSRASQLSWSVQHDAAAAAVLRGIIRDLRRPAR